SRRGGPARHGSGLPLQCRSLLRGDARLERAPQYAAAGRREMLGPGRYSTPARPLLRCSKILRPVHPLPTPRIDDICDGRVDEIGIHDVRAVLGAREPAVGGLPRARRSGRDVFADRTPAISGARDALARGAAVAADVLEIAVRRHVARMRERGFAQLWRGTQWRGRLEEPAAAPARRRARLIDESIHLLGDSPGIDEL